MSGAVMTLDCAQTCGFYTLQYFEHVIRANGMERQIMLGIMEGTRTRGRPRQKWIDSIKKDTNMNIRQFIEETLNRNEWRALCWRIARSRTRLGSTKCQVQIESCQRLNLLTIPILFLNTLWLSLFIMGGV